MASKKLADAYLELRADDSKLSPDVRVKATRIGKEFGAQLNRTLSALKIDPIDVKADPKVALASIETTRQRLRAMSRDAESVEMRIRTERAIAQVERFRKQLGTVDDQPVEVKAETSPAQRQIEQLRRQLTALGIDPIELDADPKAAVAAIKRVDEQLRRISGDAATVHVRVDAENARASLSRFRNLVGDVGADAATGFVAQFGGKVGPLMARLPLSPHLAAAVAIAAAAAAPGLAGVMSAAVVGGAGAGGIIGGVKIASTHPAVQQAAKLVGDDFTKAMQRAGVSFVPVVIDSLGDVRSEIYVMEHDLERAFSRVSVYVRPLTQDFLAGARRGVEGFATAVERSGPILNVVGGIAERAGDVIGDTFEGLSEHSVEASHALAALWLVFEYGIRSIAGTIEMLTAAYGWLEKFGAAARGDVAELGRLAAEQAAAKDSGDGLSEGLQNLIDGFTNTTNSAAGLTTQARSLREILDELTGRSISSEQAQIRLEQAIDDATAAAKRNGDGIDRNVPKQRANREALIAIAEASNTAAQRIYEETNSQEAANAASERGRKKFLETAHAMGVKREEAIALANKLFAIPNVDRTVTVRTKQAQDAIKAVQQSMGKIKDIRVGVYFTVKGDLKLPGGTQLKGLAGGGPVDDAPGPKGVDSRAYLLAKGEHVFTAPEVDRMGGQAAVAAFRRQIMSWPTGWRPDTTTLAAPAAAAASRPLVMDTGGTLMPGWNPPIYNGTGRPESVTTAHTMDELIIEIRALRRDVREVEAAVQSVAPGVGREINGVGQTLALRGRTGAWPSST
ncbi:hypothetical protein [Micromonospora sp. NPDC004551]|uniref:hypothetical protein n=1 Tax=Micromonospora sp. NPDC004551 TaxID=3154284 RepID=UPI00339F34E3